MADDISVLVWGTSSEGTKEELVELSGPSLHDSFTEYREQPILFSGKLRKIRVRFTQISNSGWGRYLDKGVSFWLFSL